MNETSRLLNQSCLRRQKQSQNYTEKQMEQLGGSVTKLQELALATTPLTSEQVQTFLDLFSRASYVVEWPNAACQTITSFAKSHERLRMELEGATTVIADLERELSQLRQQIGRAQ